MGELFAVLTGQPLITGSWLDGNSTVAEVARKNFLVLDCPIRLVLLIPGNAVGIAGVPTLGMLRDRTE